MSLLILLIILLLLFGGGGWYSGRAGNAGVGGILYALCVIVAFVVILRLLGVWI